jgi:hypothetical protein
LSIFQKLLPRRAIAGAFLFVRRLIFVSAEHLAGFRIDQMLPRANRAGDGLISLAIAFGRIVSDPALHVQACIWAAVDEWRHYAAYSEFWISTTGGLPVTYRKF